MDRFCFLRCVPSSNAARGFSYELRGELVGQQSGCVGQTQRLGPRFDVQYVSTGIASALAMACIVQLFVCAARVTRERESRVASPFLNSSA